MWILGQSRASSVDLVGLDIQAIQGNESVIFQIVGYGIGGFQIALGTYENETFARTMFNDIMHKLRNGMEFYDVSEEEKRALRPVMSP